MRHRQIVAQVEQSFLDAYSFAPDVPAAPPRVVRYYRATGSEHRMPVAIFPAGLPAASEACVVHIEADNRRRLHHGDPVQLDASGQPVGGGQRRGRKVPGGRLILRIFRFPDHESVRRPARFRLEVGGGGGGEIIGEHPKLAPVVLVTE